MNLPRNIFSQICERLRNGEAVCLDGNRVRLDMVAVLWYKSTCDQCVFNHKDAPNLHAACIATDPDDDIWASIMVPVAEDEVQTIDQLSDLSNKKSHSYH